MLRNRSASSMDHGEAGVGFPGDRFWFSGSARLDDSRYGVPFTGEFHGARGHEEEGEYHDEQEGGHHHAEEEGGERHDEEELSLVDVAMNRRQLRTDFGIRNLGTVFDEAEITVRYSDYGQGEIETPAAGGPEEVATHFDNRSVVLRGELKKPAGRVTGRMGLAACGETPVSAESGEASG